VKWNWWSDETQGGGALGAIGSHVIDSFRWFLDTEFASVFCQLQSQIKQRPTSNGEMREVTSDDESLMITRLADSELTDDATGLISMSMTEGPAYKHRMEFYGTDGVMAVDALGELYLAKPGERDWTQIEVDLGRNVSGVADTGFARGFMWFGPRIVDAIRNRESSIEHAATFRDGLEVQRVLDAARESNRTGRVVTFGDRGASAPVG
jgi:predicted dehydrogenase